MCLLRVYDGKNDLSGGRKVAHLKSFLFILFLCVCHEVPGADQPNVIVILTDDQGWGDLSVNGNIAMETPHIDRLAKTGPGFSTFMSVQSVLQRVQSFSLEGITFAAACIPLLRVVNA